MPFIDKDKKAAYQKRTATPYMKEWREKNREKHREYMREWARKRRKNKETTKSDYQKSKGLQSYKGNALATNLKLKEKDEI